MLLINQDLVERLLVYLPSVSGAYVCVNFTRGRARGEPTSATFESKRTCRPHLARLSSEIAYKENYCDAERAVLVTDLLSTSPAQECFRPRPRIALEHRRRFREHWVSQSCHSSAL